MILQALADYYETLTAKGEIPRSGWSDVKVSWALEIDDGGELLAVLPLKTPSANGKKMLPRRMCLPAAVVRTVGIQPNFLWDNSSYLLGYDEKGKPARTKQCFDAAKALHQKLLGSLQNPTAMAVCAFFEKWNPDSIQTNPLFADSLEDLAKGSNLVFLHNGEYAQNIPEIAAAWQTAYDAEEQGATLRCLITGREVLPESVHPSVNAIRGGQSSGMALVSFNAPAFWSYGREQNYNAPVGKYAAFAYTSALNRLIQDNAHAKYIGDMTVVYWAQDGNAACQDIFSGSLDGVTDQDLDGAMQAISQGRAFNWHGFPVEPGNPFFVLGLSPNASRMAVRLFLRDTFGDIMRHLQEHYNRLEVVSDGHDRKSMIPLWALLRETVNQKSNDKTPSPQMSGDVLRAILTGGRYPATLYDQTLLRIRAEHDISRGRAAIVKAYLLRNTSDLSDGKRIKEVSTVALNETSDYAPYVLGRLFSVLEGIQLSASPGINTTIRDRFFNSACATPAAVFPILMKLSNSHLKKMDPGASVFWSKQLSALTDRLTMQFPKNLSLNEQGTFILGYYHQTQKRYEKREDKQNV